MPIKALTYAETKDEIMRDPTRSFWLKAAIEQLEQRDVLDALTDVETLERLARKRLNYS